MPRTSLIEGAPLGPLDLPILKALVRAALPSDGGTATPLRVGIENDEGTIYRVISLFGVREKANFTREMESLGFESDSLLGRTAKRGYDLVFTRQR